MEAVNKAVNKAVKVTRRDERKKADIRAKADKEEIVIKLLKTGDSVEKIADCMGLSIKEVEALASRI